MRIEVLRVGTDGWGTTAFIVCVWFSSWGSLECRAAERVDQGVTSARAYLAVQSDMQRQKLSRRLSKYDDLIE